MMKQFIFLLFGLCAICATINAQEQDLCLLLDTAYCDFLKLMPERPIFVKNWTYYSKEPYAIEKECATIVRKYKRREFRFINDGIKSVKVYKFWKKGDILFEEPRIYFYKDTIIIMNSICVFDKIEDDNEWFCYGPSCFSMFTYNDTGNRWQHVKDWKPQLQSRIISSFDTLMTNCYIQVVDSIKKKKSIQHARIYEIGDYSPISLDNTKYVSHFVPSGFRPSSLKKYVDYFIGYPRITLCGRRIRIEFKYIASHKVKDEFDIDEMDSISFEFDMSVCYYK